MCILQQQGEAPLIHPSAVSPPFLRLPQHLNESLPQNMPWDGEGRQAAISQALQTVSIPPQGPTETHKSGCPQDAMGLCNDAPHAHTAQQVPAQGEG